MCHKNEYVWESLLLIMTKVLCEFPHHGIWAMLSAAKSTNARRSKRCATAFSKAKVRHERASSASLNKPVGDVVEKHTCHSTKRHNSHRHWRTARNGATALQRLSGQRERNPYDVETDGFAEKHDALQAHDPTSEFFDCYTTALRHGDSNTSAFPSAIALFQMQGLSTCIPDSN